MNLFGDRWALYYAGALVAFLCLATPSSAASHDNGNNVVYYTATQSNNLGGGGTHPVRHARALLQSAAEVAAAANETVEAVQNIADDVGVAVTSILNTVRENVPSESEAREALEELFAEGPAESEEEAVVVVAEAPEVAADDELTTRRRHLLQQDEYYDVEDLPASSMEVEDDTEDYGSSPAPAPAPMMA